MIKIWGIPLRIHPLFSVTIVFSILTGSFIEILLLFSIVFVHEWGHITVAKAFHWKIRQIQILPFGGVAEVEEQVPPSKEEVLVTLAGPLQNVMMMGIGYVMVETGVWSVSWGSYFIQSNFMIALFNLMPIPPLDGGKLMHVCLCYCMPYYQALKLTALIGMFLCTGMIGFSIYCMFISGIPLHLMIIAIFLFYSNWYSLKYFHYQFLRFLMSRLHSSFLRKRVSHLTRPIYANKYSKLSDIVKLLQRERSHLIYICNQAGKVTHILTEPQMVDWYFNQKKDATLWECILHR